MRERSTDRATIETVLLTASKPNAGARATGTNDPPPDATPRGSRAILAAFGAYLVLAVVVWWNVWSSHPSGVAPCSCSDPALVTWFMAWPAHALLHGLSPFYSSDMFHPTGINLLSNASSLALGIPLAPVTWLFGPVATLNVAATLTPALSALAMFWLLRRWVRWAPAAFVAGIVYGFSPLMLSSVAVSHLMTAALMTPPLIVACLDELFVRQRRPPGRVGLLLGVLVIVQFFLGTELLAVMVVAGAGAFVVLVAYGLLSEGTALLRRLPHALRGLWATAIVAVVALAYPLWFLLSGPAHLSGQVWGSQVRAGSGGIFLHSLWSVTYPGVQGNYISGYRGGPLPAVGYLGPGILVVVAAGTALWRHDRRLWFFGVFALMNIALSVGDASTSLAPWTILAKIPLIQNIIPYRFMTLTHSQCRRWARHRHRSLSQCRAGHLAPEPASYRFRSDVRRGHRSDRGPRRRRAHWVGRGQRAAPHR